MKKEIRKELEMKISAAIASALPIEQKVAISKTKKAIDQAGKMVAKKFSKAIKAIEKEKKRLQKKVSVVKKKKKARVVKKKK